ncbi:hypothetical protein GJ496_000996 [Pomphorhynchus laevis]|nr:hypothetical protein GJ496_000996 [Pomphorhynchus laevis]
MCSVSAFEASKEANSNDFAMEIIYSQGRKDDNKVTSCRIMTGATVSKVYGIPGRGGITSSYPQNDEFGKYCPQKAY